MAVTQYIGAAYVAHGWTTWNAQTSYDNMYVVEYQNGNYISKKNVPAGNAPAGNQGDNEYWAYFGVKSAQIEEYRQQVIDLENSVGSYPNTILAGKNIAFFGDSLTYGLTATGQSDYNYPAVFGKMTQANVTNFGVSGAQACQLQNFESLIDIINNSAISNMDYIFVQIGINDYARSYPIGKYTDNTQRFKGALQKIIETLYNKVKSNCNIIFISLFPCKQLFENTLNAAYNSIYDFNKAIIDVCSMHNIRVIDLTKTAGITEYNYNLLLRDSVHYNDNGYEMIGMALYQAIASTAVKETVETSPNIIMPLDFSSDFTNENLFGFPCNIVLKLDAQKFSTTKSYTLKPGYYTLKAYIYNENVVTPLSQQTIYTTIKLDNTILTRFYNYGIGVTPVETTFYVPTEISGIMYITTETNITGATPTYMANISLNKGKICTNYEEPGINYRNITNINYATINDYLVWKVVDNNVCLVGSITASQDIVRGNIIIPSLPSFGNINRPIAKERYIIGFNTTTGELCLFSMNLTNQLVAITSISNGDIIYFNYQFNNFA